MTLPSCFRCGSQPCTCSDGCTIYHADCREILPHLGPVDLMLTDPNYGHGKRWQGGTWGADPMYRDAERWDAERTTDHLVELAISRGQAAIVWGGNYFRLPPSRCWLAWIKREQMATLADFELAWTSFDKPSKSFECRRNPQNGKRLHPTQKPLGLFRWCIEFAGVGETVLDPFAGAGTSLLAARDAGRRCVGIELSEKYCEIAAERLRQNVLPLHV